MTPTDLAAVVKAVGTVVREYTASAIAGLTERMAAVESRALIPGPVGERGERGEKGLDGAVGQDGTPGPPGSPGDQGQSGERGTDGTSGPEGPAGPPGPPGSEGVRGADGKDGRDGEPGAPGVPGERGEKGLDGPIGTPGRDGRDGFQGKDGRDGIDGAPGPKGLDGFGFEHLSVTTDGERTFFLRFVRGEQVQEFPVKFAVLLDRGVYKDGKAYEKGDGVTFGGSYWIAQEDTAAKPDLPTVESRAWRLAVKRGGEGKAGPKGEKGLDGKDGRHGIDLGHQTNGRPWGS